MNHRTVRLLSLLPLLAALAVGARAQEAATPAVSAGRDAFLRAVARAPALTGADRRAEAARLRARSAGRLPDVELETMASRMVGPMDERATMWEVNLRQPMLRRGERAAEVARAEAGATMADAERALMAGDMATELAKMLAEAAGAEARVELIAAQSRRLETVLQSLEARLASGGSRLAEKLAVQSRLAAMQLMIEEERAMAADARAEARAMLGLAGDAVLPDFAALDPADLRPEASALVGVAQARRDEADAMGRMARAAANPMTAVGLRFEQERRAMGDERTVGVALMTELPFRSRRYARADARAAESDRAAAHADADAARRRVLAVRERAERAERVADAARRVGRETVARLNAELDALTRSAGVGANAMGESTLLLTVEILERATDAELQISRAETAARVARAELWRHAPAELFAAISTTPLP